MKNVVPKPFAVWLTGLPSSGKSTIARTLSKKLEEFGFKVQILESDEVRKLLTPSPRYDERERDYFYRALAVIGKYLIDNGINVIFDATAHKRRYRDYARELIEKFIEVYVFCPIDICIERDKKGLYKLAMEGKITTLPGLQVPYEEPLNPEVKVDTYKENLDEIISKIIATIIKKLIE